MGKDEEIEKNKYNRAMALIESGNYDAGCLILKELGKDEEIEKVKYDRAMALIESGKYDEGCSILEELGKNEDAAKVRYDHAMDLIKSKDYQAAYSILKDLNYNDSAEKRKLVKWELHKKQLSNVKKGSTILFGTYEQDNDTSNGKEDIEWLVLAKNKDKALIISKYALDCQPFNETVIKVTWETCTLRKWLNKTFLNNAFDSEEQSRILSTTVTADEKPEQSSSFTNAGNDTTDKLFLLSILEADKYFDKDSARECEGTAYCFAQGAHKEKGKCNWWLRSPGLYNDAAADIGVDGEIRDYGRDVDLSHYDAVRPAMWISTE